MKFTLVGFAALAVGVQTAIAATCNCPVGDTNCLNKCGK